MFPLTIRELEPDDELTPESLDFSEPPFDEPLPVPMRPPSGAGSGGGSSQFDEMTGMFGKNGGLSSPLPLFSPAAETKIVKSFKFELNINNYLVTNPQLYHHKFEKKR